MRGTSCGTVRRRRCTNGRLLARRRRSHFSAFTLSTCGSTNDVETLDSSSVEVADTAPLGLLETDVAMMPSVAPPYPRDREADVVLRDGSTVHVRPVRVDDGERIRRFLEELSPDSIAFRFFGHPNLDWAVKWSVDVDYCNRFALIAESGNPPSVIAHAAYVREDSQRAEVAFMVADDWQGRGISTILLAHLAEVADLHEISTFTAEVLRANHRMIEVFRDSGFPVQLRSTPDAISVEFPTSLSPEAIERFDERDNLAAVAAVRSFLEPRSVAVIGASRRRCTVGGEILHNLLAGGLDGAVYAVNDHAEVVQSLPAYRSVTDIPGHADLAVIVVPAERVAAVARECVAAGVRALLVISAGFAEAGPDGARRQRELLEICRESGARIVGPNCLGAINTAPSVRLNATFAPHPAVPGRVGFMSQSGGLGIAIIEAAGRLGIGLSSFVSVGNKADLSGNDFIRYWEQDPNTDLALLYLESFGDARKFGRIAPRFARQKPLLAVKSGRSAAGARATSSHTGALLQASDVTVDALFRQAGVIRTDTLDELFGVASLLTTQPIPRGDRIAIVTNAGGPGIMCADACQADGVKVPELPAEVRSALAKFLPEAASLGNPVDMLATASAADYAQTVRTLIAADACDAVLAIFVPPLVTEARDVAIALREVAETDPGVPIAAVFMSSEGPPPDLRTSTVGVPGYEFPEEAARALALAGAYGRWRARPEPIVPELPGIDPIRAAAVISRALAGESGWLGPESIAELLGSYGLPLISTRVAATAAEAADLAEELGGLVALKAVAPGLVHKSDVGGVQLGRQGRQAVADAASEIGASVERAGYRLEGLIVQPMVPEGVELIVGVVNDHNFGPVLACGAGGTAAEVLKDVVVRITPITEIDAAEMLRSLRIFPLLDGYRGAPRCDLDAVEDLLLRVSALVEAHPEIAELDCNPVVASPQGAVIVDARIRLEPPPPAPPMPSLRS
jgi:acetyl coenzyme A synthetase (ADP forming)-like protein